MKKLLLTGLFILLFSTTSIAGTLGLKWIPNQESDLGGYKLYYTEEGTTNEQVVNVGNVTTFELTGLTTNKFYLVEITAYDTSNNESERSYGVRAKALFKPVEGLQVIK